MVKNCLIIIFNSTLRGNNTMISLKRITVIGIFSLLTFIISVFPVLAAADDGGGGSSGGVVTTITISDTGYGITDLNLLISSGIKLAIILAAIITFAFLIWGGIEWITSGGDKAKYEAARNRITAALVGLAIVAAAWAIMVIVGKFLGINILNTGIVIPSARQ